MLASVSPGQDNINAHVKLIHLSSHLVATQFIAIWTWPVTADVDVMLRQMVGETVRKYTACVIDLAGNISGTFWSFV